jgi:O-antigen/teichoic acid export membrane protein
LKIGRTLQSEDVRKSLFSYSWKTVVWQVANTLRSKVDAPVIAAFLGRSAIAPYNIGASLNTYFYDFVTTFIGNLSPLFSRYEGKGDFAAIREKFLMMTRIASVVSIFGGASIIFYSRDFILRWMGAGFVGQLPYHASYVVATILACGYTLTLMQTPTSSLFYGLSKHHYGAFLTLGEGLLNLALSLALVKRFGIYGVAWGTTIGLVVSQVFIYPVVACRVVQMPWWKFYAEIGWLAVKTCALLGGWFWLMKNFLRPDYLTLASLGFAQTLLFVPLAYFFILQRPEKEQLAAVLAKWRGR